MIKSLFDENEKAEEKSDEAESGLSIFSSDDSSSADRDLGRNLDSVKKPEASSENQAESTEPIEFEQTDDSAEIENKVSRTDILEEKLAEIEKELALAKEAEQNQELSRVDSVGNDRSPTEERIVESGEEDGKEPEAKAVSGSTEKTAVVMGESLPMFSSPEPSPISKAAAIRNSGLAYSAAIALFGSVIFMLILGWFADLLLGTSPWGKVVGIVTGAAIGFLQLFRLTSRIINPKPKRDTRSGNNRTDKGN